MAYHIVQRPRRTPTIDITPLMDLTFMLLIIFIITTPAIEYSTDVTPPQMNTPRTVEDIQNKVTITLAANGEIQVDGKVVPKGEVPAILNRLPLEKPDASVLIISDGSRRYDEVIEIHRMANHAKVKNIYLVTRVEAPGK